MVIKKIFGKWNYCGEVLLSCVYEIRFWKNNRIFRRILFSAKQNGLAGKSDEAASGRQLEVRT